MRSVIEAERVNTGALACVGEEGRQLDVVEVRVGADVVGGELAVVAGDGGGVGGDRVDDGLVEAARALIIVLVVEVAPRDVNGAEVVLVSHVGRLPSVGPVVGIVLHELAFEPDLDVVVQVLEGDTLEAERVVEQAGVRGEPGAGGLELRDGAEDIVNGGLEVLSIEVVDVENGEGGKEGLNALEVLGPAGVVIGADGAEHLVDALLPAVEVLPVLAEVLLPLLEALVEFVVFLVGQLGADFLETRVVSVLVPRVLLAVRIDGADAGRAGGAGSA